MKNLNFGESKKIWEVLLKPVGTLCRLLPDEMHVMLVVRLSSGRTSHSSCPSLVNMNYVMGGSQVSFRCV
jgi:hypothetical protein